jgi:ATP phosphoribosyltransferase regulatory subunit
VSGLSGGVGADVGGRLIGRLVAAGYERCEPPVLQPAAPFLDQSGEDIRGRLYLTSDPSGAELCLRPEYTIPVCRAYLASAAAGQPAAFSYLGPVFRFRAGGPSQIIQAGLESFGRTDREAADAEILAFSLEALAEAGVDGVQVRMADAGLSRKFLESLDLPPMWARRIGHGLARGRALDAILAADRNGSAIDHSGVLAALEGADRAGARALVQDLLSIAGIASVGGRSTSEIADRFLEQAALRAGPGVPAEKKDLIDRFLGVAGEPDDASAALRRLAGEAGLDLGAALDTFEQRLHFLAARGVDLRRVAYDASFARRLDYYTGFVFEAYDPSRPQERPLIGGGRYDRLAGLLGAGEDVPAVGAAIFVDRLVPQGGAS